MQFILKSREKKLLFGSDIFKASKRCTTTFSKNSLQKLKDVNTRRIAFATKKSWNNKDDLMCNTSAVYNTFEKRPQNEAKLE